MKMIIILCMCDHYGDDDDNNEKDGDDKYM